jgi:hypothetical protein
VAIKPDGNERLKMNKFQVVENLSTWLMAYRGSMLETWKGKLTYKEQRALFGCVIGKGTIYLDGESEMIKHNVKIAYGADYETTVLCTWNEFSANVESGKYKL